MSKPSKRVALGVTGASGSIYADRLLRFLVAAVDRVYLVYTDAGRQVVEHELAGRDDSLLLPLVRGQVPDQHRDVVRVFRNDDLFAPIASGSSVPTDMIVLPCSMGTMSRIAHGDASNLLERACDVVLKQRKNLVIAPRETPLNTIHLDNMQRLAAAGAVIAPPSPGFYNKPKTIDDLVDFVVGRMCELLDVDHELYRAWNSRLV